MSRWPSPLLLGALLVLLLPALQGEADAQSPLTCGGEPVDIDLANTDIEPSLAGIIFVPAGAVVRGTPGDDHIGGGRLICALGGNDRIVLIEEATVFAGKGDDIVATVRGVGGRSLFPNTIVGGPGNDILVGGRKQDRILGGAGNDRIQGRAGNDQIWGGDGEDIIWAHWGTDRVLGGAGDDVISGGDGNDTIDAGPGADTVEGGEGIDRCGSGMGDMTRTGCESL